LPGVVHAGGVDTVLEPARVAGEGSLPTLTRRDVSATDEEAQACILQIEAPPERDPAALSWTPSRVNLGEATHAHRQIRALLHHLSTTGEN